MLKHHRNAQTPRFGGIVDPHRPPFPFDGTCVGMSHAIHNLHERALTGAVLAEQRMDLTDANSEINTVVRHDTWVTFDDAAQNESWRCRTLSAAHRGAPCVAWHEPQSRAEQSPASVELLRACV